MRGGDSSRPIVDGTWRKWGRKNASERRPIFHGTSTDEIHWHIGLQSHLCLKAAWSIDCFCTVILFVNFFSQIYVIFGILCGLGDGWFPMSPILTHMVIKTRGVICALFLWKTWDAIDVIITLLFYSLDLS